jgi:tetratricopeptide (TPR) repeat protein
MDDIGQALAKMSAKIASSTEPLFFRNYAQSQFLIANGQYTQAVTLLAEAMCDARPLAKDPVWESIYYSIGGLYATTLDFLGHIEDAEKIFLEIIDAKPTGPYIGEYAIFVHRRKRDFDKAQAFYVKALQLYPQQSSMHLKYAGFLRHVRRDLKGAEEHYAMACETNPQNADALGSYASFLHGVSGKIDMAATYYEKSLEVDDTHTNNLCNYGLFLR